MTPVGAIAKAIPSWLYVAGLLGVLAGAGMLYEREQGKAIVQARWNADIAARATAEKAAVAARIDANALLSTKQAASAVAITKAHDEEISVVRAALAAERMRSPAFCGRPAGTAEASSAGGGAEPDSSSGLLPAGVERDIKALILETEEVAATGRACQAFVRANGMGE